MKHFLWNCIPTYFWAQNTFFRSQPDQEFIFFSEPTRMSTLLLHPSFHLNKFLPISKNTFRETAYRQFFQRKIWQHDEWIFRRWPRSFFFLFQSLLGSIHSYSSPHFFWTIPWLDWWNNFCETAYRHIFERKFWQRHEHFFFVANPIKNSFFFSEPNRLSTLLFHPSFHLNKFLPILKNTFRETAYRQFFQRKIWQHDEWIFRRWPRSFFFFFRAYWEAYTFILAHISFEQFLD